MIEKMFTCFQIAKRTIFSKKGKMGRIAESKKITQNNSFENLLFFQFSQ